MQKTPLNRSILVVAKFVALHCVRRLETNLHDVFTAFVAKSNRVKNSAIIIIKTSSLCGEKNKTLEI